MITAWTRKSRSPTANCCSFGLPFRASTQFSYRARDLDGDHRVRRADVL
jgi:hypothetical protein